MHIYLCFVGVSIYMHRSCASLRASGHSFLRWNWHFPTDLELNCKARLSSTAFPIEVAIFAIGFLGADGKAGEAGG